MRASCSAAGVSRQVAYARRAGDDAFAQEWADAGVRVNCLAPSRAATPMRAANFSQADDLRDLVTPEQVAIKVEMILSANATGTTFLGSAVPELC